MKNITLSMIETITSKNSNTTNNLIFFCFLRLFLSVPPSSRSQSFSISIFLLFINLECSVITINEKFNYCILHENKIQA
jgi:hypothetical protein